MARETYDLACPRCGYKESGLLVTDIEENTERVSMLATCRRCRLVLSVEIPPRRSLLAEHREQLCKTIKHIQLARRRYLENLERRIQTLQPRLDAGQATPQERARLNAALEARRRTPPADVSGLQRTLALVEEALRHASDEPPHHHCGEPLLLHRETTSGYQIDCPRCGEGLVVRLVERR